MPFIEKGETVKSMSVISRIISLSLRTLIIGLCVQALGARPAAAQDCSNPNGALGDITFNEPYDVFQGCTPTGWQSFHEALKVPLAVGCPNPGNICTNDGTMYAGQYAGHKLYMTAVDAPGSYTWNDGNTNWLDLDNASMPNCPTLMGAPRNTNRRSDQSNPACMGAQGPAFTPFLANFSGTGSPYVAAAYCYHLGKATDPAGPGNPLAHGRNDWYLPAVDEVEFIYDGLKAGQPAGTHGFQHAYYWSSTETASNSAWAQSFTNGEQSNYGKANATFRVRCFRR